MNNTHPLRLISKDDAEFAYLSIKSSLTIRVNQVIDRTGMNRLQLAEATGMSYHSIGYVQHGSLTKYTVDFLIKLLAALDVKACEECITIQQVDQVTLEDEEDIKQMLGEVGSL